MELLGYADIGATGKLYRNKWAALARKEIFYYSALRTCIQVFVWVLGNSILLPNC